MSWRSRVVVVLLLALSACTPAPAPRPEDSGAPAQGAAVVPAPRQLAVGLDEDLKSVWDAVTGTGGSGAREIANVLNQQPVAIAHDGSPQPRLLAELPSFERGTWRVLPDGKMETTWKLRPNTFWHDGAPFTPDDVLFSFAVNRDPEVPSTNQEAVRLIDRMDVVDAATVLVTWSAPYPFADRLEHREFFALPKHILERSYQESKEAFLLQPYFNEEFVGLGPYRVARWERGSHLDLAAFDRYFLGRPKIDAIRVHFIPDLNTMLANFNARSLNTMFTVGTAPEFGSMLLLKRDWEASGYGTVQIGRGDYRFLEPQKRSFAQPLELGDPRVRRALLLAIDRAELGRSNFDEYGVVADSWVHPALPHYPRVQDAITHHPYDPRQALATLEEVGWRRGADGALEKGGQRFALTMRDNDGEKDSVIIANMWKGIGVLGEYERRTGAAIRDRQDVATFTGVAITVNPMAVLSASRRLASVSVPTAENRWTGNNRGGYSNGAWDELDRRAYAALREETRLEVERELLQLYTTELPLLPLYYRVDVLPVGGGLTNITANTGVAHRGFILHTWNIHEWDLR